MMNGALADLRFAARKLSRAPGFTIPTILILGLGIGANSTIFTLVSDLFLQKPPAVQKPDELVRVNRTASIGSAGSLSYPDYAFYRDHNRTFAGLAAYDESGLLLMARTGERGAQVQAWFVSGNYFDVLGVRPAIGRAFLPDEDRVPGQRPVVVISHGFWQDFLGGDPEVLGRTLTLNGHTVSVVGVAPPGFRGVSPTESPPDLWAPIMMQPVFRPTRADRLHRVKGQTIVWLQVLGRLEPGTGFEAARADLTGLARRLEEEYPEWNEGVGVALTEHYAHQPRIREQLVTLMRLLMGVAAVVLLVACANIAILFLARASARDEELGVRMALGAGRGRIARPLLAECLLLAFAGGAVGLVIAVWSAEAAGALIPASVSVEFRPDIRVLGFTFLVSLLAAALFATAPVWQATRHDVMTVIKRSSGTAQRSVLRNGLVVAQIALAIALVSGAGLFIRSLRSARSVELGFEPANRLLVSVNLQNHGYDEERGRTFVRGAVDRLAALPGVRSVTTTRMIPLEGIWTTDFVAEGRDPPAGQSGWDTGLNIVGPNYFRTLAIPLLRGRDFTPRDDRDAAGVVIVNETLADRVWAHEDPIGKLVGDGEDERLTVVGVARTARYYSLDEDPYPQLYVPQLQMYQSSMSFVLHTTNEPSSMAPVVERELRALDPDLALSRVRTLGEVLANETGRYRVIATLVSLFGVLAVVLAVAGLYAVLSFVVVLQTRDIGIRVALGARQTQIAISVLGRGLRLAGAGIALGLAGTWLASGLVRSFLFGVSPHDLATFTVVPVVLVAVSIAACYLPARRATRVDPLTALRAE